MPDIDAIVRRLDRLGTLVSIGGRTLLLTDTNPIPQEWTHITKVDPEEAKRLPLVYPLYLEHTSAVSVGGSKNVTEHNTLQTFDLMDATSVPSFHEPSEATHVTEEVHERAEFMAIPEVLNGDTESIVGALGRSLEHGKEVMAPKLIREKSPIPLGETVENRLSDFVTSWLFDEAVFEAYIIMNVDSAAAEEANVTEADVLTPQEAKQHAMAAEHHLESEVIYLEYSGSFGGEEAREMLEAITDGVYWSRIWYGGGLDNRENTQTILDAGADAVIVGNIFHCIAAEEREHCEEIITELGPGVERSDIEQWVRQCVDLAEFSGTRYLSTIPDIADPKRMARQYLVAALETHLALMRLRNELDVHSASDTGEIERLLHQASVPGPNHTRATLTDGYFRRLAMSVLADTAGLTPDLPVSHLNVELVLEAE